MRFFGLLAGSLLLLGSSAHAIQFTLPSTDTRLHTLGSGQPGAEWNTGANGPANGEIDYDSGTERLTLTAEFDVLNYWDLNEAGCPTDVGSNCTHNFATNLDITLEADLDGIVVSFLGGTFYRVDINFMTTGGTDLTVVDSTDATTVLSAEWQSGIFGGTPTTGLQVSAFFDSSSGLVLGDFTGTGFFGSITGAYAQLFDNGASQDIGLTLAEVFNEDPAKDAIALALVTNFISNGGTGVDNSALVSFTADGEGQVFSTESGQFVPEPGTLALFAGALGLLALRRRSS